MRWRRAYGSSLEQMSYNEEGYAFEAVKNRSIKSRTIALSSRLKRKTSP